ncbi:hypothetical protein C2G38_2124475, partial [Gigaspora rosea]
MSILLIIDLPIFAVPWNRIITCNQSLPVNNCNKVQVLSIFFVFILKKNYVIFTYLTLLLIL